LRFRSQFQEAELATDDRKLADPHGIVEARRYIGSQFVPALAVGIAIASLAAIAARLIDWLN
jgi:hypothetical protein